jgi:AraC family transcriptional regulator
MEMKLIERQPKTIACLRHVGPYGAPVTLFWLETAILWIAKNGLLDRPRYGIGQDDPRSTAPEQCRYDACVEVTEDFVPHDGAFKTTIQGGSYAAHHFKGTSAQLSDAWMNLFSIWLPASGLRINGHPFEYFPAGSSYDPARGVFDCEICIPVVSLKEMTD